MSQEIDFLPASYHAQRQLKTRSLWRQGILCAFVLLAVAGAIQQRRSLGKLRDERDRAQDQLVQMESSLTASSQLQQSMKEYDTAANLLALLHCRVPPTRLIGSVMQALPENVSLTEFQISRQRGQHRTGASISSLPIPPVVKSKKKDEPKLSPVESDLEQLIQRLREQQVVISLRGIAPNDMAISNYLAALKQAELFETVQLKYTDLHLHQGHQMRSFAIDLEVRSLLSPDWNLARVPGRPVPLSAGREVPEHR